MHRMSSILAAALAFAAVASTGLRTATANHGSVKGQFVLNGDVPADRFEHRKGATVKDAKVCAARDFRKDDLVVDKKTKGIANIFVYILKFDKARIHPDLKATPEKQRTLVFDQKGCRFTPHAMFIRTDQTVLVKSDDDCAHNTHTYPLANEAENFVVTPKFRKGVPLKHPLPEFLPIKVGCDIHPWMRAHWLILDHPYAAVTGKDGKFQIDKLPVGEYEFRVWHERVGYLSVGTRRGFRVKIEEDGTSNVGPFKIDVDKFEL